MIRTCIALLLALFVTSTGALAAETQGNYTAWGVDEYEFFNLSKQDLAQKFKDKLCFEEGYDHVHLAGPPNEGCRGYLGPVFKLRFMNNKVVGVQALFEGCKNNFYRPDFTSKKDALKFAIQGLSSSINDKDKQKLKTAQRELAALQSASRSSR
ncbi:MAG: hypothetical protein SGJ27_16595 [Candidatus Melainabacteria bacterium]|nr:hypothetical protein [Candidatus Melainabacteria bacterium]